jgi:RNA polymerase sigma factor (sigma-70 family)
MVGSPSVALVRDMQTLFDAGTVAGLSDRQLLDRFMNARDGSSAAAFEVLVRRHGPMVLRVCRNILKDWNDAEDAFQATFVVLARRCGSIRRRDSVESWLFGVASRVAARARVEAARRRAVERRGATEADAALGRPEGDQADLPELGPIVQDEVQRLPERYRAPVVLCYWEGLTHEQAAAQLGCPIGTIRSRIARARDLLRRRLSRRGVAPIAGLAASGFDLTSVVPVPAAVPDPWIAATLQAITPFAAGGGPATAGAGSATVGALVQYILRRMLIMKLKTTATCLFLVGLGAAGVILAAPQVDPDRSPSQGSRTESRTPKKSIASSKKVQPSLRTMEDYVVEPPDLLLVEVLEALPGRPISGERLVRPDGKISLGFYGEIYVAGLTITEVKEKIVQHLRKYLNDESLGLVAIDENGEPVVEEKSGKPAVMALKDTDRVFVDVTAYNSKMYYVQGEVHSPGLFNVTGHETILDAINYAGGLTQRADHKNVVLHRKAPDNTLQRLPIDIDQVMMGDDPTTNYQIMPGDRLVIPSRSGPGPDEEPGAAKPSPRPALSAPRHDDRPTVPAATVRERVRDLNARRRSSAAEDGPTLRDLGRRLDEVEQKLDRILDALGRK